MCSSSIVHNSSKYSSAEHIGLQNSGKLVQKSAKKIIVITKNKYFEKTDTLNSKLFWIIVNDIKNNEIVKP